MLLCYIILSVISAITMAPLWTLFWLTLIQCISRYPIAVMRIPGTPDDTQVAKPLQFEECVQRSQAAT
jgi:hypothetical protein